MPIAQLSTERLDAYFDFCRQSYPWRRHVPERFAQQVLANPLLHALSLPHVWLALDDDGQIAGQFGLNPFQFWQGNERKLGYCGFDFFVREEQRSGAGGLLAMKAVSAYRPFFAIGVSETAEQIYLKLRCRTIGSLRRHLWLRSPLAWAKLARGRAQAAATGRALPDRITAGGVAFRRLSEPPAHWSDAPFADAEITFARPPAFLRWRFFMPGPVQYHCYEANAEAWFVVRAHSWRGLSLLAMVDYPPPRAAQAFASLLAAVQALARAGGYDGVLALSSHTRSDDSLSKSGFRAIGQPHLIMTNAPIRSDDAAIAERRAVFATLADYDMDFAAYD